MSDKQLRIMNLKCAFKLGLITFEQYLYFYRLIY
jgi:hypothetical protein